MNRQLEILIHVSGPSHGIDDARYRREAQGFLNFEPVKSHHIFNHKPPQSRALWTAQGEQFPSFQRDAVQEGQSLGTTQKLENIRLLFHKRLEDANLARVQQVPHALRSPGAGSRPASSALPWTDTQTTSALLVERTPAISRPHTAPNVATRHDRPQTLRRTRSDSWQTPPSVIPDSQASQHSIRQEVVSSPILNRPTQLSSPSPTRESFPATKRARLQSPSLLPSSSQELPCPDRLSSELLEPRPPSSSQARPPLLISEPDLPLEIHPPRPRIANAKFTSHLTPSLRTLASRSPLSKFFTADYSLRPVDPLERGHWLIYLSFWDIALKNKFWTFLTHFIGAGYAGWGVWCIRELVDKCTGNSSDKENESPAQDEVVRIYCWGEVVREIWLGLYGGSEKMIQRVGAKWIGADGNVVVERKGEIT
ncbi:MAG: hypothetical protein Q9217_003127 [Psora testacea]